MGSATPCLNLIVGLVRCRAGGNKKQPEPLGVGQDPPSSDKVGPLALARPIPRWRMQVSVNASLEESWRYFWRACVQRLVWDALIGLMFAPISEMFVCPVMLHSRHSHLHPVIVYVGAVTARALGLPGLLAEQPSTPTVVPHVRDSRA